ncbi:DUF5985 family protein [Chondromyces crocatus]|uniref:Membrane protein n=1 Tax=Chondromyces crocatus TaxID=52 RepID=A0A0K1E9U2_CHOCO|nr:DUF5985 family protein [Chondromyces crocatus]AKT37457.1 membrane protein [Chondromyces crocatus]
MAAAVYLLCALTSIACMVLLLRGYAKNRVRLLLWSGLGFAGFAVNNILLFVDLVLLPTRISLAMPRNAFALLGLLLLLYGLLWDMREGTRERRGEP